MIASRERRGMNFNGGTPVIAVVRKWLQWWLSQRRRRRDANLNFFLKDKFFNVKILEKKQ